MKEKSNIKERFIKAAIDLICARSYNTVGVQELCDNVGVTKGSFYHYFPSKRDLTLAAIDEIWAIIPTEFSRACVQLGFTHFGEVSSTPRLSL